WASALAAANDAAVENAKTIRAREKFMGAFSLRVRFTDGSGFHFARGVPCGNGVTYVFENQENRGLRAGSTRALEPASCMIPSGANRNPASSGGPRFPDADEG